MDTKKREFIERAYSVKKRFLSMYKTANAGHVACSLSCTEILVFLKFHWMRKHDNLILSKGHAAGALYSVLAEDGVIPEEEIKTFYQNGTYLGGHPPANKIKEIPFATGSLGHGLPVSSGMAFASRLKNEDRLFFCVTSDGELDEGSVWESALFINQHKHYDSLLKAKNECLKDRETPKVIICKTVKGHGISYMENKMDWHYLPMSDEQYSKALEELKKDFEKEIKGGKK
ncbi:MAG: transketolase [Candidatus Saganbacteria bacterium]|nr:transketolase [Candidatus Saganbacteria bacterium]